MEGEKKMKLSLLFGLLCIVCLGIYGTLFAVASGDPAVLVRLSLPLMLSMWGAGAFFILAIVMFVIKR
jgi:membrane protein implicated in regulation of membrane protease activity